MSHFAVFIVNLDLKDHRNQRFDDLMLLMVFDFRLRAFALIIVVFHSVTY